MSPRRLIRHAWPWALIGYLVLALGMAYAVGLVRQEGRVRDQQIRREADIRDWKLCDERNKGLAAIRDAILSNVEGLIASGVRADPAKAATAKFQEQIREFRSDQAKRLVRLAPRDCGPKPKGAT